MTPRQQSAAMALAILAGLAGGEGGDAARVIARWPELTDAAYLLAAAAGGFPELEAGSAAVWAAYDQVMQEPLS